LTLLIFLDLCICHGLSLLERFAQQPALHALLLQLDLMVVEDAVESGGTIFGELTPFRVEFTRVL
jgi:hypothetical protein